MLKGTIARVGPRLPGRNPALKSILFDLVSLDGWESLNIEKFVRDSGNKKPALLKRALSLNVDMVSRIRSDR